MGRIGEVLARLDLHPAEEQAGEMPAEPAGADLPAGLGRDLAGDDWVITGAAGR